MRQTVCAKPSVVTSQAGARSRSENYRPSIPEKYTLDGRDFRKYLAKQLGGGSDIQSEKTGISAPE
ncbi:MAG: hypothetical protein J1F67_10315 [Muribaculaceae bacterium]|nr:hypothetical protein [Muribaculaceae bacterium]